ncbi:hypothetical protein WMF31_37510 [Sorangium sp. So ce1036]|uniref:hypothetical protein n=1 Tax=Sorangium sp. So ce1036 TaxID=3133328 RepID=UPI003F058E34
MRSTKRASSLQSSRRGRVAASPSFDALAVSAQIGTTLESVINARTAYQDRCHQREVVLAMATEQARAWDAEAERRHDAFRRTLALATRLAESGHVEQALEVLSRGVELLSPVETSPRLPSPVVNIEGT